MQHRMMAAVGLIPQHRFESCMQIEETAQASEVTGAAA
jgi:hypothetical protein